EKHVLYTTKEGTQEDRMAYFATADNSYRRFAGVGSDSSNFVLMIYDPGPVWNTKGISNQAFGSRHAGVCQFVLADGSVKALTNTTDVKVLSRLANRSDGEVVGDF